MNISENKLSRSAANFIRSLDQEKPYFGKNLANSLLEYVSEAALYNDQEVNPEKIAFDSFYYNKDEHWAEVEASGVFKFLDRLYYFEVRFCLDARGHASFGSEWFIDSLDYMWRPANC